MMRRANRFMAVSLCLGVLLGVMGCGGGQREERAETDQGVEEVGQTEQAEQGRQAEKAAQDRPTGDLLSAREAFSLARKAAEEWSPDAVLVEINTFPRPPQPDGRGSGWKFEFNSATQGEKYEVHIRRGKVFQTMTGKLSKMDTITGRWMDSPEAMRQAADRLSVCTGEGYWMGLSMSDERPVWRIKCSEGAKQQAWVKLDAVTGDEIDHWPAD
jgi:hypothetical protein